MAAVTNHNKSDGLKQHKFIYSLIVFEARSLKSVSQGKGVGRALFFLEALRENLFPCLF